MFRLEVQGKNKNSYKPQCALNGSTNREGSPAMAKVGDESNSSAHSCHLQLHRYPSPIPNVPILFVRGVDVSESTSSLWRLWSSSLDSAFSLAIIIIVTPFFLLFLLFLFFSFLHTNLFPPDSFPTGHPLRYCSFVGLLDRSCI